MAFDFSKYKSMLSTKGSLDEKKISSFIETAINKAAKLSGTLEDLFDDVAITITMVKAHIRKEYTIPNKSLMTMLFALAYFVCPADVIPDILPGGFIDDGVMIAMILSRLQEEVEKFKKETGGKSPLDTKKKESIINEKVEESTEERQRGEKYAL